MLTSLTSGSIFIIIHDLDICMDMWFSGAALYLVTIRIYYRYPESINSKYPQYSELSSISINRQNIVKLTSQQRSSNKPRMLKTCP